MKLNLWERLLVNNPARSLVQHHVEAPVLLKIGGRLDSQRVLEIGCGRGVGVEVILDRFGAGHVTAIDLDANMIARARTRLEGYPPEQVTLAVGDAESIDAPDRAFDAVFDFGILHHVPRWQKAVAEVARVLKPGGSFFFEEVTKEGLERWIYRTFLEHPKDNRFTAQEFVAELERAGIKVKGRPTTLVFRDVFVGVGIRT